MLRAQKELTVASSRAVCRQRRNEEPMQRVVTSVLCGVE